MPITKNQPTVTSVVQWIWIPILSIALFAGVYYFAVLTPAGQTFENAALSGQNFQASDVVAEADEKLAVISYTSLAVAIVIAFIIGLIRKRPRLAVAGAGTIAVSAVVAEILKRFVLARPELVAVPDEIAHNSFPSGHTTIAMSILMATMIVIPYRGRGWAMLFVFPWAIAIGAATIAAHWHRLSDTLGGDLIALTVGCLFSLWLAKSGEVTSTGGKRYIARGILVGFWAAVCVVGIALGVLLIWMLPTLGGADNPDYQTAAYQATHVLASAGSILAGLVFWLSWHRLQIPARG